MAHRMYQDTTSRLQELSRCQLEALAHRALLELAGSRRDARSADHFRTILAGFLAGAAFAAAAFVLGASVG